MANFVLQELAEGMKDGKKTVFPKMQIYSLHDFETVLKHMQTYAGNFSEGSMRAVIDALVSTMASWMPLGHNIKIDGLGVFSLSLGFDTSTPKEQQIANGNTINAVDDADNVLLTKNRHICIKSINFKPDPELLKKMNRVADFDRVETEIQVPRKCTLSKEERLSKAISILRANGFMTLTDYALATGLSRSVASNDLKAFVAESDSGITTRGSHSHKVWVLK